MNSLIDPKPNWPDTICKFIRRYWLTITILIAGCIFFIIALQVVDPVDNQNNDFFTFWLAGRLALTGENPYQADVWIGGHHQFGATWIPNSTFIYPLPLSLLFAPFGLLTYYQAYVAWVTLSQVMILVSFVLLLKTDHSHRLTKYIPPLVAGIILFRSTLLTLRNGQLSALLLLITACVVYLWEKDKWWQGGVLLPLLALKPNLGVPILFLLSLYLIFQKRFKSLLAVSISGLVIVLIGLVQNPQWITEFWNAGNTKLTQTFGYSATVWGISNHICQNNYSCSIALGGLLGVILVAVYVILLLRKQATLSPALAISLAQLVALMITPYSWPYDQLLLVVPLIVITGELAKAGYPFLPVAVIFLLTDLLAIVLLLVGIKYETEIWNVFIPLSIFGVFCWYLLLSPKEKIT